jgi:hypothetical protein
VQRAECWLEEAASAPDRSADVVFHIVRGNFGDSDADVVALPHLLPRAEARGLLLTNACRYPTAVAGFFVVAEETPGLDVRLPISLDCFAPAWSIDAIAEIAA